MAWRNLALRNVAAASKRPTHAAGRAEEGGCWAARQEAAAVASTSTVTVGKMAEDSGKSVGAKQNKREDAAARHCGSPAQCWREREQGGLSLASLISKLR